MGRFRLDITKKIVSDGCHTPELCCGISTKKITKAQLDKALQQPHLLNVLWEGGWKRWPPQVPSHLGHFAVLWKTLAEVIRGGHTIYTIFISKTTRIVIIAPYWCEVLYQISIPISNMVSYAPTRRSHLTSNSALVWFLSKTQYWCVPDVAYFREASPLLKA